MTKKQLQSAIPFYSKQTFCQEKALGVLFALRTALSLLQVSAQSFQSHFESEKENEGWPGQRDTRGVTRGTPAAVSLSLPWQQAKGWSCAGSCALGDHFYPLILGIVSGSFSWCGAVKKISPLAANLLPCHLRQCLWGPEKPL